MCIRLQVRPLKYFVDFVCYTWDLQKKDCEPANKDIWNFKVLKYVPSPGRSYQPYATPGVGNVCEDGVHPNNQGCNNFFNEVVF